MDIDLDAIVVFGVSENRAWLLVNLVVVILLIWSGVEWKKCCFICFC